MHKYAALFGFALLCACGSPSSDGGSGGAPCVTGESIECAGPGGCAGFQVCAADGQSYGVCGCENADGGDAIDAARDGSIGTDGAEPGDARAADATLGDASPGGDASSDGATAVDASGGDDGGTADGSVDAGVDSAVDASAADAGADSGMSPDASTGNDGGATGSLCAANPCSAGQTYSEGLCSDPVVATAPPCTSCFAPNAQMTCVAETCAIASCVSGYADCDGNPANGCEADLTSAATCGACATQCTAPDSICSPSGCVATCGPPMTQCAGGCFDLATSPGNCGQCTGSCPTKQYYADACVNGTCEGPCSTGATSCTGACVDTTSDPRNCGGCGNVCTTPANPGGVTETECVASTCVLAVACQPGWTASGGTCVPPSFATISVAAGVTVTSLAIDGTNLYWVDGNSLVQTVPTAGGAVVTLAQFQAKPVGVAVDADSVYWADNLGGAIMKTLKDGTGTPLVVSPATSPSTVALGASSVYWIDSSSNVWTAPKSGTTTPTVALTLPDGAPDQLVGGPVGLFTWEYTSGEEATIYELEGAGGGGFVFRPASSAIVDAAGTALIFTIYSGLSGCQLENIDITSNCSFPTPLLDTSCGLFYSQSGKTWLNRETSYSTEILPSAMTSVVADANFLYFSTGTSIEKLPL